MKYQHKKTNELLTIKKLFGSVVICEGKEVKISDTLKTNVKICSIDNLIDEN